MFSNSAYEALYQLLGLSLHAKFIEWITGETFFKMLVLMIFGSVFFFTLLKFVSRYLPGSLIDRKQIPLSRFVKIVACLFLGLAILRVGTDVTVKDFQGKSWADNSYDVKKVCAGVEHGDGRIIKCLKENTEKLSPSCKIHVDKAPNI